MARIPCTACASVPQSQAKHCHECRGLRYIEGREPLPEGCTGEQPVCPVEFDPMVGGWECWKCGRSGPL